MAADILTTADQALARFDPTKALAGYDEALTRDANSPCAAAGRVRALWMLRRGDEARGELDDLTQRFPESPEVAVAAGMVALGMRDDPALLGVDSAACLQELDRAAAEFARARQLSPWSIDAIRGQATVFRLRGEFTAARELLDQTLTELGPVAPLLVERAQCEIDQWHLDAAVSFLQQVPLDVEAQSALLLTLGERVGNHTEAFTLLQRLRTGPGEPALDDTAGWLLSTCVFHMAKPEDRQAARQKARDAFKAVLDSQPRNVSSTAGLAWLDRDEHGATVALTRVDKALEAEPYSPQLNGVRGWLLLEKDTPEDSALALESFRFVRDQAPYLVDGWSGLISAATSLGDLDAATEAWAQMEKLFPGNPMMFVAGSRLAAAQARHKTALELAEKAFAAAPGRRDLVAERASTLFALGYYAEASQPDDPLKLAADQWPGDPWLRLHLLWRAEAEGRLHEALTYSREIVTLLTPPDQAQAAKDREKELRRQIRRRPFYRLFGRGIDADALPKAGFTPEDSRLLERHVPADLRRGVETRLRTLNWRSARQDSAVRIVFDDNLLVWLLLTCGLLLGVLPWLGGYFGDEGWWNIGRSALAIGCYILFWVGVVSWTAPVITFGCVVVAVASAWSLLPGGSALHMLVRSVVLAPAVVMLLQIGLMIGLYALTDHYARRITAAEAHAVMMRDLLGLLWLVEREPAAWEPDDTRTAVGLIESVAQAQAQAQVIRNAAAGDKALAAFAGHRALGVAAATADLKQKLVTWDARTTRVLYRRASRMLDAACRGEWGRFRYRVPDRLPRQLRLRLSSIARMLILGGVVALGIWLVFLSRESLDGTSATLTAVTGLLAAVAPVVVPLVEYVTKHGDRFDPRRVKVPEQEEAPPMRRH
jgi:Tetratricopeptide repeat